jgi:integrase
MARKATGQVVEWDTKRGRSFGLRFRAYGQREYVGLGTAAEGWSRQRAEEELQNVLADVRRGTWRAYMPEVVEAPQEEPTFHTFASEWLAAVSPGLADGTVARYTWQLTHHLLPALHALRLSQITVAEVDRYREAKVREGRLSAGEINKTLVRLGQILDVAEERELIGRNPMRVNPRRRKLKASKPRAIWLDRAEQITALLDAAAELDVDARGDRRHVPRRVIVECFVFAGLRIEELCELRWRDVDLAAGRLNVANSKTDAGRRHVQLLAPVREGLATHKASGSTPGGHVFATRDGGQPSKNNVRARVFNQAVKRANANLERDGLTPLPEGLTPHKLRHTFASLLMATGQDPVHVMGQLGHTDPAFSLRVYGHAMSQDAGEKERLRALVDGSDWANTGKIPSSTSEAATAARAPVGQETAHLQGER